MASKKDVQEKFDEQLIEKLEKTKFWDIVTKNADRFESSEKDFFLDCVKRHYCLKEREVVKWYVELISVIATSYQPAIEAKRFRLMILINQFDLKKKCDSLKLIIPSRRIVISKK